MVCRCAMLWLRYSKASSIIYTELHMRLPPSPPPATSIGPRRKWDLNWTRRCVVAKQQLRRMYLSLSLSLLTSHLSLSVSTWCTEHQHLSFDFLSPKTIWFDRLKFVTHLSLIGAQTLRRSRTRFIIPFSLPNLLLFTFLDGLGRRRRHITVQPFCILR